MNLTNYLSIESLHDGLLSGIEVVEEKQLTLVITTRENKTYNIVFLNTKSCRFDNFRLGNIVFSIEVYQGKDVDNYENRINELLCYLFDLEMDEISKPYVLDIKESLRQGKILLVELEASYGVEGVILCEKIVWSEG